MSFETALHKELAKYKLILGSTSPRRQEILQKNFGLFNFDILASNFAENLSKDDKTPLEYVSLTSKHKAEALLLRSEIRDKFETQPTILLTCDTVVACNGEIFEKPETKKEQRRFFNTFAQNGNVEVISAVTVIRCQGSLINEFVGYSITKLIFKPDNEETINAYIESEEGLQVAGGFKYQEKGCLLFKGMDGDYLNVVGLPTCTFDLLSKAIQ